MLHQNREFNIKLINYVPLEQLKEANGLFVIFKHSPRCSISNMAKSRIERSSLLSDKIPFVLVDVLTDRALSNQLAVDYSVQHQSPQILIISGKKCIYHASHQDINPAEILTVIQNENGCSE